MSETLNISEAENYARGILRVVSETLNVPEAKDYVRNRLKVVSETLIKVRLKASPNLL